MATEFADGSTGFCHLSLRPAVLMVVIWASGPCYAAEESSAHRFEKQILPILSERCFDCHGYGASEGGLELDRDPSAEGFLDNPTMWWAVLKNLRAGVMPPDGMPRPEDKEVQQIASWIKSDVFLIDPRNVDPGPANVRRMNRFEYGNTIRDLMGIDFNVAIEFPPDDSGFGFDNVGDVLGLSPLMMEKYLRVAKAVVDEAVPKETKFLAFQQFHGNDFRNSDGSTRGRRISFEDPITVSQAIEIDEPGLYRIVIEAQVDGSFWFDPSRCSVVFSVDDQELTATDYGWKENFSVNHEFEQEWQAGKHTLSFKFRPLPPDTTNAEEVEEARQRGEDTHVNYEIHSVKVEGPLDPPKFVHPKRYNHFFTRDEPPASEDERRGYAVEVLEKFTKRAFRRPTNDATIERLVTLAVDTYRQSGATFEAGIAQAMMAALASPRFLLLVDHPESKSGGGMHPYVDEYSLASRLSYFFWSTMPDDELMQLADRGELRKNLDAQVERMLHDPRSEAMIRAFVGQWLRARDVEHVSIDPIAALGLQDEWDELRAQFRRRRRRDRSDGNEDNNRRNEDFRTRFRELREIRESLNAGVRRAMREETEMLFEHIVQEDRSVLELIDSDYTFVNEALARHYGIEGVRGERMRLVSLPAESPRGGVLTQGTMLTVTSNPTRTSPVKRGLFILDNILGTPPPPAPPGIPELEEAAEKFDDRQPTLREVLAVHRDSDLCASCHARMDPLGLALENFNALGTWRDDENGQPIDASGELISGESFRDVRELKRLFRTTHKLSFYRCLTEKMLTYALGRGLDYYDVHTVDEIVAELEVHDGRIGVIFQGIVRSAPFQRLRHPQAATVASASEPPAGYQH